MPESPSPLFPFYASAALGANQRRPDLLLSHTGSAQPLMKRLPPGDKDRIAVRVRPFVPLHHHQRVARLGKAAIEFLQRLDGLFRLPEMRVRANEIQPIVP